jgi:hypothetical protein
MKKTLPALFLLFFSFSCFPQTVKADGATGFICNPENGKTYSCTIKFKDGKSDRCDYTDIFLIDRTQTS